MMTAQHVQISSILSKRHSINDLESAIGISISVSIKLCPPVSNRDIDQSVLLLNGEHPQLECSIPKDDACSHQGFLLNN